MRIVIAWLVTALALGCVRSGHSPGAREAERRLRGGDPEGALAVSSPGPVDAPLARVHIAAHLARRDPARAVAAYRELRRGLGTDDAQALRALALSTLWTALRAPDPETRVAAILVAERRDLAPLTEELTQLLQDPVPLVRVHAAAALLGDVPEAARVLTRAADDADPGARRVAIAALARQVGAPALPGLRAALADADPGVRRVACAALAEIGEPADVAALLALAAGPDEPSVRAAALTAALRLGARRDEMPAGVFAGDQLILRMARAPLGVTAGDLPVELAFSTAPGVIARGAADRDWTVRALAANRAHLAPAALATVVTLSTDPHPEVRAAAARALATLGREADARIVFGKLLAAPAWHPRLLAAAWLAGRGDARGLEALTALSADTDADVRVQAVGAAPARADLLLTSLVDPEGRVRVAAAARLVR